MDDETELLRSYDKGSQDAFTQIVRRHAGWVHAAATRRTRNAELAEDVTQATFILLARNAHRLRRGKPLGPWLFRVMSYAAATALRAEARRDRHERNAGEMQRDTAPKESAEWGAIKGELDEMVAGMKAADREALVLRFYEGRSFAEMGGRLGIGEDGARKRVARAVAKLRAQLEKGDIPIFGKEKQIGMSPFSLDEMLEKHASAAPSAAVVELAAAAMRPATQSGRAAALAREVSRGMARAKLMGIAIAACVLVATTAIWFGTASPVQRVVAPPAPAVQLAKGPAAILVTDPKLLGPNMAPGWPLALPGSITGTPVVADLEGNGKLCVVVPCETLSDATLLHPSPTRSAMLYAFHADGSAVPGWPVELVTESARNGGENSGRIEWWSSSPSVCMDSHGKARIVITTPYFLGFRVVTGDAKVKAYRGGSQWSSVPLVDIDGDGIPDIITGAGIRNIDGGNVRGFPSSHPIARMSGYAPCIGDARGDGHLEVYHLFADTQAKLKIGSHGLMNPRMDVMGFDQDGKPIAGWPREIGKRNLDAYPPVMGDLEGDGKMEIVAADQRAIYAWRWDGQPLLSGDGTFRSDVQPANTSATLADLDGDGKAEIIIFDEGMSAIRAWHGDGTPVAGSDGVIATIPMYCNGVSVADLDGDGVMDLFAGTYWVKFDPKTKQSSKINMLGEGYETNATQPTICDLGGDGKADVIFGLKNGAVVVYQTQAAWKPQWGQWVTANGNFQHTGCWRKP